MVEFNNNIVFLIRKLNELTKISEIKWRNVREYLETEKNDALNNYLIIANKYMYSNNLFIKKKKNFDIINEYSSYCTEIDNGMIYIFTYNNENSDRAWLVCAQNTINSRIVILNTFSDYQDDLILLFYSIERIVDNIDHFIDSIINKTRKK